MPVRGFAATLVAGLVAVLLPLSIASPASAGSTILCSGYSGCAASGMSDGGYKKNQYTMYWRMYVGTNCTNYVAYRLVKNGMANTRPWSSTGNAYNWGLANARITDQVPTVGSVAWFNRSVSGAGSVGHVAYVEQVVSSTEIIVSESNWRGEFDWRRIVKDSKSWPSGFIHFNDQAAPPPVTPTVTANTAPPVITGNPAIGETLTVSAGTWTPAPTTITYAWLADGVPIPGANATTFSPTEAQRGKQLTVRVAAASAAASGGAAYSSPTVAVTRGRFEQVTAPTVAGAAEVDEVLTATAGSWAPEPEKVSYFWLADGERVAGAEAPTLPVDRSLAGKRITAGVVVRRAGYIKAKGGSPSVGPVVADAIEVDRPYVVRGRPRVGNTISLRGSYAPQDASAAYAWLRDGKSISGADQPSYKLQPADAGREIVGQVTLSKRNFLTRVEQVSRGRVTVTPTVGLKSVGKSRKALVVVRVKAPGFGRPSGEVSVKIGKKRITVPVTRGKARARFVRLKPGKQRVVAKYAGSRSVARARSVTRVVVGR